MFQRYHSKLEGYYRKGQVLGIYGARRTGKTTLIKEFLKATPLKYKFDSGDNILTQETLGSSNFNLIKQYCEGYELIVIDEAQNIPNIGQGLKIIVDELPELYVIATGSSSFDLSNKIGEPLVGRQKILKLFPIAQLELSLILNRFELKQNLQEYLIFGTYPETLLNKTKEDKKEYLLNLVNAYLLKDILALENIRAPKLLLDLLKLLAFQVGNEVSLNELATSLKIDVKTVDRYLDLLEKNFIINPVGGFSRNLRSEITSKKKYYFNDNGIRNALINNFNTLDQRNDIGMLWENFIFMERLKKKSYQRLFTNDYFWRTYSQKEIDLIEERDGKLSGYEFKWRPRSYKPPKEWVTNYPGTTVELVSEENYLDFIL
jgi:predicted AAA+ superfamily ATPase